MKTVEAMGGKLDDKINARLSALKTWNFPFKSLVLKRFTYETLLCKLLSSQLENKENFSLREII